MITADSHSSEALEELAIKQLQKLRDLSDLLEKERVALTNAESEEIISLSEEKSELISQLQRLEQNQHRFVDGAKASSGRLTKDPGLLETKLQEIRALSKECMDKNQVNGRLVGSARSSVLAALEVVRNEDISQLYSNTGICEHEQGKKSLGTA